MGIGRADHDVEHTVRSCTDEFCKLWIPKAVRPQKECSGASDGHLAPGAGGQSRQFRLGYFPCVALGDQSIQNSSIKSRSLPFLSRIDQTFKTTGCSV